MAMTKAANTVTTISTSNPSCTPTAYSEDTGNDILKVSSMQPGP